MPMNISYAQITWNRKYSTLKRVWIISTEYFCEKKIHENCTISLGTTNYSVCSISVQALMSMGSFEALSAGVFAVLGDCGRHPQCVIVGVYPR